jgi:hypothetical protein
MELLSQLAKYNKMLHTGEQRNYQQVPVVRLRNLRKYTVCY